MRYFWIYADESNPQPQFSNWYQWMNPRKQQGHEIFDGLEEQSYWDVKLDREIEFMDLIQYPHFMVSREFANLIRIYNPAIAFKNVVLIDKKNKRTVLYRLPDLPEIDCLCGESELSRDKREIKRGILMEEKIQRHPVFRLKGVSGKYIIANLELVESAYRRKIMGMRIHEFIVQ